MTLGSHGRPLILSIPACSKYFSATSVEHSSSSPPCRSLETNHVLVGGKSLHQSSLRFFWNPVENDAPELMKHTLKGLLFLSFIGCSTILTNFELVNYVCHVSPCNARVTNSHCLWSLSSSQSLTCCTNSLCANSLPILYRSLCDTVGLRLTLWTQLHQGDC